MARKRTPFDPETMGFGKHDYQAIDPDTVNPEKYATDLRGEEKHFGDIRQYNAMMNEKHPENDVDLDWLSRMGTIFRTEAEDYEGEWEVVGMPLVQAPAVFAVVRRPGEEGDPTIIDCVELGVKGNRDHKYLPVKSTLVKKGDVSRRQRERLTKS